MRIISHRGNTNGRDITTENTLNQIELCIEQGFDVEVDVWNIKNELYLGHDEPLYKVTYHNLSQIKQYLWVHCKNIQALDTLKYEFNAFGHDKDDYVLTTKNFIWVYPNKELCKGCIAVMPEQSDYSKAELNKCYAVCTDFPNKHW